MNVAFLWVDSGTADNESGGPGQALDADRNEVSSPVDLTVKQTEHGNTHIWNKSFWVWRAESSSYSWMCTVLQPRAASSQMFFVLQLLIAYPLHRKKFLMFWGLCDKSLLHSSAILWVRRSTASPGSGASSSVTAFWRRNISGSGVLAFLYCCVCIQCSLSNNSKGERSKFSACLHLYQHTQGNRPEYEFQWEFHWALIALSREHEVDVNAFKAQKLQDKF